MDYPKLRNVEAFPVEMSGKKVVGLRDPYSFASETLFVPYNLFYIISLFDGRHSILDIQTAYTRQFGDLIFSDKIKEIVEQLDNYYFLESDRFAEHRKSVEESFSKSPLRPAVHAGAAYPAEPEKLREELEGFFTNPGGPGAIDYYGKKSRTLKGMASPHIDLRRGGSCFAWAYKEVAESSKANLFVILGISHTGLGGFFTLTKKDFVTPLGTLETDGGFVDELSGRYGGDLFSGELSHKNEHSIEFQLLFLQYIFGGRRDIKIVPILCSSFHRMVVENRSPAQVPEVGGFISALRELVAARGDGVCLVAGVDLSHVGMRFGDREELNPLFVSRVEHQDREMLKHVERMDAEGFFNSIQVCQDRQRVCGYPAIYTLMKAIGAQEGVILKYDRAVDYDVQSAVTFASIAFY
jgi:AmmeMemoRadiSam system protein B